MKSPNRRRVLTFRRVAMAALATIAIACTTQTTRDERVARLSSPVFTNGDFETGTAGQPPPSWTIQPYLNNGITVQTPQTRAGLNLATGGTGLTTIVAGSGPLSQSDPDLGSGATLRTRATETSAPSSTSTAAALLATARTSIRCRKR